MKKNSVIFALCLLTATGCKILPQRVEYFQKEVQPIPEYSEAQTQRQKQAAAFVAEKTLETKEAALQTGADVSVVLPATEGAVVAEALSTAMGPPTRPYAGVAEKLAAAVQKDRAQVDQKIDKQRDRTAPLVGKEIEGTGAISMSWFTQIGLILGFFVLVWAGLKIYGLFNPIVGAGLGVTQRVTSKVAAAAFSHTAAGLEHFKDSLRSDAAYSKQQVKDLLATALQKRQDSNVQDLAYRITRR